MTTVQVKGIPTNVQIQIYGQAKAEKMALVQAIQAGDKVTALFPNGLKLVDGKAVPVMRWIGERIEMVDKIPGENIV